MSGVGPSPRREGEARGGIDWDLLADHLGGALAGTPEQERVAHLVATDPAWATAAAHLSQALAAVATDLARVPAPSMPPDVADRIDAAIRGAGGGVAPGDSAVPGGGAAPGGEVRPVGDPSRWRRRRRRAGPGRADGSRPDTARPGAARPGTGRPGTGTHAARARRRRATRWGAGLAVAAALMAVVTVGVDLLGLPGGGDDGGESAGVAQEDAVTDSRAAPPDLLASGTDYRRSSLPARPPPAVLAGEPDDGEAAPNVSSEDSPGRGKRLPGASVDPALRDLWSDPGRCLAAIDDLYAPDPVVVEALDFAAFEGEPALVGWIDTGAGDREVLVVGAGCGRPGVGADVRHRAPVQ